MTRNTEPKFTIIGETENRERATRLALFDELLRRRPEVTAAVLKSSGTVMGVLADSRGLNDGQRESFEGRVLLAVADVFINRDDLAVRLDPESKAAIRASVATEMNGNGRYDTRVLSMAAFACEHAAWQQTEAFLQDPYVAAVIDLPAIAEPLAATGGLAEAV